MSDQERRTDTTVGPEETKPRSTGGGWRYQPVFMVHGDELVFSLCECYFAKDGTLARWTEEPAMIPQGESIEDLSKDLARMMGDAYKWKPVAFNTLHVGMRFEPTGVNVEAMIAALNTASLVQA